MISPITSLRQLAVYGLVAVGMLTAVNAAPSEPKRTSGKHHGSVQSTLEGFSQCHLSNVGGVPLCTSEKTCLTPPPSTPTPTLISIVLGVGTQNYTCLTPTSTPTPNGALATLYDISCTLLHNPVSAHLLPPLVMQSHLGLQKVKTTLSKTAAIPLGLGYPKIGTHYFAPNAQTPVFVLEGKEGKTRRFVGGRLEGVAAPVGAGEAAVDWLKLGRAKGKEGESEGVSFVYRVHTASGKPPATCEGVKEGGDIVVDYATEYWFYE